MASVFVEILCPDHGMERFKIKILRRMNIASDRIIPKFRTKPTPSQLSCLYIGRNVSLDDAKKYVESYIRENIRGEVIRMKMLL